MKKSKGYKVVLNSQFGGFSLSKEAVQMLNDRFDLDIDSEYGYIDNDDWSNYITTKSDRRESMVCLLYTSYADYE